MDITNLTKLINDFRTINDDAAITPDSLGRLLQQIADKMALAGEDVQMERLHFRAGNRDDDTTFDCYYNGGEDARVWIRSVSSAVVFGYNPSTGEITVGIDTSKLGVATEASNGVMLSTDYAKLQALPTAQELDSMLKSVGAGELPFDGIIAAVPGEPDAENSDPSNLSLKIMWWTAANMFIGYNASTKRYCLHWSGCEAYGAPMSVGVKPNEGQAYVYGHNTYKCIDGSLILLPVLTSVSEDLALSESGKLSLTDMAKKRLFIDMWNKVCAEHGRYNPDTGFFELNGLTDITYEQAILIYNYGQMNIWQDGMYCYSSIRTNIPSKTYAVGNSVPLHNLCENSAIEVFNFGDYTPFFSGSGSWYLFANCSKLKKVMGRWRISSLVSTNEAFFRNCTSLTDLGELTIMNTITSLDFRDCPSLTAGAFSKIVKNTKPSTSLTLKVTEDIFNKLFDTSNNEWHAVLTAAAAKNISFATE